MGSDDGFDYSAAAVRVLRAAGEPMTHEAFWTALMHPETGLPESDRESYLTGPFEPGPSPHNFVKLKITAAIRTDRDLGPSAADRSELQQYGAEVFRGGAGYWLREWGPLPEDESRRRRDLDAKYGPSTDDIPRSTAKVTVGDATEQKKGGCYIATAVYGSYEAPEVLVLREFRDLTLARSHAGRAFIRLYYAASPPLARRVGPNSVVSRVIRPLLDAVVNRLERN